MLFPLPLHAHAIMQKHLVHFNVENCYSKPCVKWPPIEVEEVGNFDRWTVIQVLFSTDVHQC